MVNSHLERRKKLATLHKSTIVVSPDPLPSSEGLASETTQNTEEGLAHFERFLGCADSAGMKHHSLNQIAVFQNVIKNHMIVMKSAL